MENNVLVTIVEFAIQQGPAWVLLFGIGWFFATRIWPRFERMFEIIENCIQRMAVSMERLADKAARKDMAIVEFLAETATSAEQQ